MANSPVPSLGIAMPSDEFSTTTPRQQQPSPMKGDIHCICGSLMNRGKVTGTAKCQMSNCQKELTGSVCLYCPNGTQPEHRNGFFLCRCCAQQVSQGNIVIPSYETEKENGRKRKRGPPARVEKQGYMNKRGSFLKKGSFKKSWFKLYDNKKLAYSSEKYAANTEGQADLSNIKSLQKKGQYGLELSTKRRSFSFLLSSPSDRDDWFDVIQSVCLGIHGLEPAFGVIEDDIDVSFIEENCGNWEDAVPLAAYSQPTTPHTPPPQNDTFSEFPDMPYCGDEGHFANRIIF